MSNALKPDVSLLSKLGSIVIHAEEMMSEKRHHFDEIEFNILLSDPEVREWIAEMDKMVLLPIKR